MATNTTDTADTTWRSHLLTSGADIRALLERTHRIAVLGIKPDPMQPAHYVPEYAQRAGYEIVPVPVYYPDMTDVLGEPFNRSPGLYLPASARNAIATRFAVPPTSPSTSTTSSPSAPRPSGCSSASATTKSPSASRAKASTSCRTSVC